jgi:hypothetical protein
VQHIRLDVPHREWIGPHWANEAFAQEFGFEFTNWPNLLDITLHTLDRDNPLNLIRGISVSRAYYAKKVPREYQADRMQRDYGNQEVRYGYGNFNEVLDEDALRRVTYALRGDYGLRPSILEVWRIAQHLGMTNDSLNGTQLGYTLKFESAKRFGSIPELHYPKIGLLSLVLRTMHFRDDNPKVVCWYDDPELLGNEQPRFRDLKVKSARWPKFLQMLNRKFGFNFTDDEIQSFATWVGENLKIPKYTFRLVSGDNIPEYYNKEYFGSCMHENEATEFYADQKNVQMLIIEDEYRKYVGRALVWKGSYIDGADVTLLDRVYPSDGGRHIKAAMQYAKEQGWEYKVEHSIGGALSVDRRIKVRVKDNGNYPYMDTFQYASEPGYDGYFILSNNSGNGRYPYTLDSTDNYCPWEDRHVCDNCGDAVDEDDITYIYGTGYCEYCRDCNFSYDDMNGDWIDNEYAVEVENSSMTLTVTREDCDVVYSEAENAWYWIGRGMFGIRFEPISMGTYGYAEDDYIMNYISVTMPDGTEHIVHENDDEALMELKAEGGEW